MKESYLLLAGSQAEARPSISALQIFGALPVWNVSSIIFSNIACYLIVTNYSI